MYKISYLFHIVLFKLIFFKETIYNKNSDILCEIQINFKNITNLFMNILNRALRFYSFDCV